MDKGMKVYLSAAYERRMELCVYAKQLEEMGYELVSTWLNGEDSESDSCLTRTQNEKYAKLNITDVNRCDIFVAFTGTSYRGGRHVEYGMALEKTILIVGDEEHMFHILADNIFETSEEWLAYMGRNAK